jgi:hypothetical protein
MSQSTGFWRYTPVIGAGVLLAFAGSVVALRACYDGGKRPGASTGPLAARAVQEIAMDPAAPSWEAIPPAPVSLMPQNIAYPTLAEQSIKAIRVKVQTDARHLAVRLEWDDPTVDDVLEVDKYSDGVAIEIPLKDADKTSPFMGNAGQPVYVCHWKAAWQRDVDVKRTDVQDLHPGFWADPYPFVAGGHPYPVQDGYESANARRYLPGLAAANPVSKLHRTWPVEELHAEGFGSLADHRFQDAKGRGRWANGKWSVVLVVPRESEDAANPRIPAGTPVSLAFAVWEGGKKNVGGRKQFAPWVKVTVP